MLILCGHDGDAEPDERLRDPPITSDVSYSV